ncbi:MAG: hypothetical protein WKF74_07655 [Pyrinomonadaceae bacterium]|jgi:hypothetical protein
MDRLPFNRKKFPFELAVAGWQETRRLGLHPVIAQIIKPQGNTPIVIERPPRNWHLGGRIALLATPAGYVSDIELSSLKKNLPTASPDIAEKLLVNSIRRVASRNPQSVGKHCMSVLLPPLGVAPIRIRFIPNAPHTAVFTSQSQNIKREISVAFSPWIIGPNMLCSPSVQVGSGRLQMGPFEIEIEAPNSEKGILGFMGSQHRPLVP